MQGPKSTRNNITLITLATLIARNHTGKAIITLSLSCRGAPNSGRCQ